MGIMNFLSGGRARGGSFDRTHQSNGGSGQLAANYSPALTPTTPAAITPINPGNFSSIRSAPILTQPRYFNREEAAAIRQAAAQKRQQVGSTKSAYKGLKQIEKADAIVHSEHRDYETVVGRSEAKKKRSDVTPRQNDDWLGTCLCGHGSLNGIGGDRANAQIQAEQQQRLARHAQTKARLQGVR